MIEERLDEYLSKALVNYDLPGLAVGVQIEEGSTTGGRGLSYYNAVGYKDMIDKAPLLPEHIFHMASVTKLFVSTAILQLWEKGLLELEERITAYLPWFEMRDGRYADVTIRQLLSHTSGMPDVKDYHWDKPETDEGALERYVRSKEVRAAHLLWTPAEGRFAYSNIGYEVLGLVISKVSGMSFEDYVRQNIFEPMGMKASSLLTFKRGIYREDGKKDENLCTPHTKNVEKKIIREEHFPYNRAHGPSSTLTSNVFDLGRWGQVHLKQQALKKETYKLAWQEQAQVPNNGEHIGLGWFCREQNGFVLYGHEGTDDGFRASFWICPKLGSSIVVCSNITGAPVKRINKELFDLMTSGLTN